MLQRRGSGSQAGGGPVGRSIARRGYDRSQATRARPRQTRRGQRIVAPDRRCAISRISARRQRRVSARWKLRCARDGVGPALALVAGADAVAAVGALGRAGQPEQAELPDLHSRPQGDRQVGHVGQLERDVPGEPRVDEPGGGVGEQPEPAQRALALQPAGQVVGQRHRLERGAEHELARVQHERLVVGRLDRPRSARPAAGAGSMWV